MADKKSTTEPKSIMDFTKMMDPTKMMDFTKMMDTANMTAPKEMLKQMVEFYKTAFENSFKGFFQMQEQTEQMTLSLCDKVPNFPEAVKKALDALASTHKDIHHNFISMMDDSFKKTEEYLSV